MLKKIGILVGIVVTAFLFFYFDLHNTLSLEQIQSRYVEFQEFYNQHSILTPALFFATYVIVTGLSLPGAVPLTLLGGALFGLWIGAALVSFASTIGASLAFLGSRYLLKETVEKKFNSFVEPIQKGVQKNGGSYLFSLRLIPVVPFFAINLVSGLTAMPLWKFYAISQIGMLPGTLAYVNAGTQLTQIRSLSGILSLPVIGSLLVLGLLPLVLKTLLSWHKNKKIYRRFKKPAQYQYNLVAIGGGAAGLVTSYIAAAAKAKVALIEKHKMGGDCLNTGCVPSKTLIRTAKFLSDCKKSADLGVEKADVQFHFRDVMSRVQRVIQKIEPHDSVERYTQLGVDCLQGEAKLISPWEIEVNGQILTTKNIVVATGARPFVPPIPGLHNVAPLTSDTLWDLNELPKHLLVLGGGAIGLELAQAFLRLGSRVTLIERSSRLLEREDKEVSLWIEQKLRAEGLELLLSTQMTEFKKTDQQKVALCKTPSGEKEIVFDQVLVAVGRKANTSGFGMETLGVELTPSGAIQTNDFMQTN
ncbi:FAD-dependent oxidoreductase, partial [bacterium]|nr:FAD-dependent oxidoreductase [bacterium]